MFCHTKFQPQLHSWQSCQIIWQPHHSFTFILDSLSWESWMQRFSDLFSSLLSQLTQQNWKQIHSLFYVIHHSILLLFLSFCFPSGMIFIIVSHLLIKPKNLVTTGFWLLFFLQLYVKKRISTNSTEMSLWEFGWRSTGCYVCGPLLIQHML